MDNDNPLAIVLRDGAGMSAKVAKLAGAMSKVQGAVRAAEENATNPHFRSRFSDLGSVIRAGRGHLAAHGVALIQLPFRAPDGSVGVAAVLLHQSGEWIGAALTIPIKDNRGVSPPQAAGIIISYCRRYLYQSLVGFASGADTDGEMETPQPPAPAAVDTKSDRFRAFQAEVHHLGLKYEDVAGWCAAHNRPRPSEMTRAQLDKCQTWLHRDGVEAVHEWLGKIAADEPQ